MEMRKWAANYNVSAERSFEFEKGVLCLKLDWKPSKERKKVKITKWVQSQKKMAFKSTDDVPMPRPFWETVVCRLEATCKEIIKVPCNWHTSITGAF